KLTVGNISYLVKSYTKGSAYEGLQHAVGLNSMAEKFIINGSASVLNTKGTTNSTQYIRHNFDVARSFWKLTIGGKENTEHNEIKAKGADTLSLASFYFREYSGFIGTRDTAKSRALLNYKKRYDDAPRSKGFVASTEADEITFSTDFSGNKNHQ